MKEIFRAMRGILSATRRGTLFIILSKKTVLNSGKIPGRNKNY